VALLEGDPGIGVEEVGSDNVVGAMVCGELSYSAASVVLPPAAFLFGPASPAHDDRRFDSEFGGDRGSSGGVYDDRDEAGCDTPETVQVAHQCIDLAEVGAETGDERRGIRSAQPGRHEVELRYWFRRNNWCCIAGAEFVVEQFQPGLVGVG
jgi:hypothetical protein